MLEDCVRVSVCFFQLVRSTLTSRTGYPVTHSKLVCSSPGHSADSGVSGRRVRGQVVVLLSMCRDGSSGSRLFQYGALRLIVTLESRELLRVGAPELVAPSKQTVRGAESARGGKNGSRQLSACYVGRSPWEQHQDPSTPGRGLPRRQGAVVSRTILDRRNRASRVKHAIYRAALHPGGIGRPPYCAGVAIMDI